MKNWLVVLLALLLTSPLALATDYPLDANLVSPGASEPWINIADCEDSASQEALGLRMSWSLGALYGQLWTSIQEADVFISSSESCSTVTYEIGETAENGSDADVQVNASEGKFPILDADDYWLTDLIDDSDFDCASAIEGDYYLCFRWEHTYTQINEITDVYYGAAAIRIDLVAPFAPSLDAVNAGERNLKISWTEPDDDDVAGYYIYYRVQGATEWDYEQVAGADVTDHTLSGLTNETTYEITVSAYDLADNEGDASVIETGTPTPIEDFFEYYKGAGGAEDGGFCFVATAAYGSYDDQSVRQLRAFRDEVLNTSQTGQALVATYYQLGPRWARAIRHDESAKAVARWSLAPVASVTAAGPGEWIVLLGGLLVFGLLAVRLRRYVAVLVRRIGPAALALVVGAGLIAVAPDQAQADELTVPRGKPGVSDISAEPLYQLQLRFGLYGPEVDSESGLTGSPFQEIFGSSTELLFEVAVDYQIWRGFGAVTLGGSLGFVQYLGKGRTESGEVSTDTTVFNLIPMRLTAGYHFTKFEEWWGFPVVPYVQGGLSYYVWWVTDGVGDTASYEDPDTGSKSEALGGIFGLHVGVGLKILLDGLDNDAAASLESEVGVINTFLFAEYSYSWVNGFDSGDHLNVGDDLVMFGLMMDF